MDKAKLDKELEGYTPEELEYIHETQQDLYTPEELAYLLETADRRRREIDEEARAYLPEEVECPKCGGPNEFDNEECEYCGHALDKTAYLERARGIVTGEFDEGEAAEPDDETSEGGGFVFHRVVSFVIPLVGLIMGAVMLASGDEERRAVGKSCILLAVAGVVVGLVAWFLWVRSLF